MLLAEMSCNSWPLACGLNYRCDAMSVSKNVGWTIAVVVPNLAGGCRSLSLDLFLAPDVRCTPDATSPLRSRPALPAA